MYERTVIGALNIVYFVVSVFYKTGKNDGVMQNVNRGVGRRGDSPRQHSPSGAAKYAANCTL